MNEQRRHGADFRLLAQSTGLQDQDFGQRHWLGADLIEFILEGAAQQYSSNRRAKLLRSKDEHQSFSSCAVSLKRPLQLRYFDWSLSCYTDLT